MPRACARCPARVRCDHGEASNPGRWGRARRATESGVSVIEKLRHVSLQALECSEAMTMDLGAYPLCQHFLAGYLSVRQDPTNFPVDEFPDLFDRYEKVFKSALDALGLSKEELRNREEFD